MKIVKTVSFLFIILLAACNSHEYEKQKGISLDQTTENEETDDLENNQQFKDLVTRPGKALLTWHKEHQLISIFKLNYTQKLKSTLQEAMTTDIAITTLKKEAATRVTNCQV